MYPSSSGGNTPTPSPTAPSPTTPSPAHPAPPPPTAMSPVGHHRSPGRTSPPLSVPQPPHLAFPRAGIDPITDPVTAFGVICTAVDIPYRHQVICLLLNHDHTGAGICVVHDTVDDQAPAEVVELLADHTNHEGRLGALAIASVRPGGDRVEATDIDMWELLDDICISNDVTLLEWWIIGDEVLSPRRHAGDHSRWPSDR